MSFPGADHDAAACPHLGVAGDPKTRFLFATAAHRCHVGRRATNIELDHQARFCLTEAHPGCRRYRAPVVPPGEPQRVGPKRGQTGAGSSVLRVVETSRPAAVAPPTATGSRPTPHPAGSTDPDPVVDPPDRAAIARAVARAILVLAFGAIVWLVVTGGTTT